MALQLELDADDVTGNDGDAIQTWPDSSGNARDATQATSTLRPLLKKGANGINGHNALLFDGTGDRIVSASFFDATYHTACTIYAVAQLVSGTGTKTLCVPGSGNLMINVIPAQAQFGSVCQETIDQASISNTGLTGTGAMSAACVNGPTYVFAFSYDGASVVLECNGLTGRATSGTPGGFNRTGNLSLTGGLCVGAFTNGNQSGNWLITYVAVYDEAHDAATRKAATATLRATYGVTLPPAVWGVGDSTFFGLTTTDAPLTGAIGRIAAHVDEDLTIVNNGISGTTSAQWGTADTGHLDVRVTNEHVSDRDDYVFVSLGINDGADNQTVADAVLANYQAMGDRLLAAGFHAVACDNPVRPVAHAPTIEGGWETHFSGFQTLLDNPASDPLDDTYYSDGTHPNDAGANEWGKVLAGYLYTQGFTAPPSTARRRGRFGFPLLGRLGF